MQLRFICLKNIESIIEILIIDQGNPKKRELDIIGKERRRLMA